jgi:hypothetical protein
VEKIGWDFYYTIYILFKTILLNFKILRKLNFTKKIRTIFSHILVVILQRSVKFEIYMLYSLRVIKKTNSKKYGGVGETLLREFFSKNIVTYCM